MNEYLSSIPLNQITIQRSSLSFDEAVAVWLFRFNKKKQHTIAALFGTNAGRIAEVLTEKVHPTAKAHALELYLS